MLPTKITVGTMNFGARTPEPEARRIVDRALERGATFFDTANLYEDGRSEEILGRAVKGRREQVGIATKVGLLRRNGKPEGLSAVRVGESLDESLRRLGTDYVDLYYLHAPDPHTPFSETVDAIARLLETKRIRSWGVSNFAAWQIGELNALADARGIARPAVSQVLYNLLVRQLDVEYFPFSRRHPIHTTVFNPLAGGLLARTLKPGDEVPRGSRFEKSRLYRGRYWSPALLELSGRFAELAKAHGLDLITLSYAWLAGHPDVHSILAGPGSLEHLDAALDAMEVRLSPELRAEVDRVYRAFVGTEATYIR